MRCADLGDLRACGSHDVLVGDVGCRTRGQGAITGIGWNEEADRWAWLRNLEVEGGRVVDRPEEPSLARLHRLGVLARSDTLTTYLLFSPRCAKDEQLQRVELVAGGAGPGIHRCDHTTPTDFARCCVATCIPSVQRGVAPALGPCFLVLTAIFSGGGSGGGSAAPTAVLHIVQTPSDHAVASLRQAGTKIAHTVR